MNLQNYSKVNRIYFFEKLLGDNPVIVEAGSISGNIANHFEFPIIIYEPSRINFKILKQNVNNAKLWNKGLDSFCGERLFYDYNSQTSASVHLKEKQVKSQYFIEVVNLERVFEENEIDRIDLLFLSCEGCEYKVLRDVNKFDIRQISVNFACNSYNEELQNEIIGILSDNYHIMNDDDKYPIYLMLKKC